MLNTECIFEDKPLDFNASTMLKESVKIAHKSSALTYATSNALLKANSSVDQTKLLSFNLKARDESALISTML